jgi:hypothetical protein
LDYAKLAWFIIEETVKIARNDLVDIKEKRRAFEVGKARREHEKLNVDPGPFGIAIVRVQPIGLSWKFNGLNAFA